MVEMERCPWARQSPETEYHDTEWGVPIADDRRLFEFLILEGAQAGLSWRTVLLKREGYREAFFGFDIARVAELSDDELAEILTRGAVVRNRLKIGSARKNARAALQIQAEHGSLARLLWSFVGGRPRLNAWKELSQIPASTPESAAMSRALAKQGMSFIGPTICYALMQAVGMVNDHLVTCPRHAEIVAFAERFELADDSEI